MKKLLPFLFALVLSGAAWAAAPAPKDQPVDQQAVLNDAVNYLDDVIGDTLASLQKVAATDEARSGEWHAIKHELTELDEHVPGVYFYVRPDGNYYTVAQDNTNLNLSNRPYFAGLFKGSPVKGFPVYSRSTGKKSAVVAVPIKVKGKVTGALGVSIFLDELNTAFGHKIALPKNFTWFVLDANGTTMLDRGTDYILMNPLTQGSPSLREAVSVALQHKSGAMKYTLDTPRFGHYKKLQALDWWVFVAKVEGTRAPLPPKLTVSLERFVPALQQELSTLDASMTELIGKNRIDVTKENEVRGLLRAVYDRNPDVIDVGFIETNGTLRYLEPRDYRNFENADISMQEQVIAMKQHPAPLASKSFMSVEGFWGVTVDHPLFGADKKFEGTITALVRPELFIRDLLKESTIPEGYELWIMQPDGRIIYDQDKGEIGKMLFSDPMYKDYGSLLELGKKIAAAPEGEGDYIFLAPGLGQKVIKNAAWKTVRLYNLEWRVILAYRPYDE